MVGGIQISMDGGNAMSIFWQMLPYALLTLGEVLVSATGLEFAYSQAPPAMKGAMMSFWNLSVTIGNLWVLLSNAAVRNDTVTARDRQSPASATPPSMMFFFAALRLRSRRWPSGCMRNATAWPTTTAKSTSDLGKTLRKFRKLLRKNGSAAQTVTRRLPKDFSLPSPSLILSAGASGHKSIPEKT